MPSLNVTIDSNSGFCFGVVYAIQMAEDILAEQGYLYCLGDIVHNDEEVARLQKRGLRIGTIPVEDSMYSMLMLLLTVSVYERLRYKRTVKQYNALAV